MPKYCAAGTSLHYLTIYFLSIAKNSISLCVLQVVAYVELRFFILRLYYIKGCRIFGICRVFYRHCAEKRLF